MNDLERTRSEYSRWIRIHTLCIFSHHSDKNLFQGRFEQLKTADARAVRSLAQQLLRISPWLETDLHIVAVVVERLDQIASLQGRIAFVLHLHMVLAVARLDLGQIALQDRAALLDEADGVTQALPLVHEDEIWIVQQGSDELDLLLHSFGKLFPLLVRPLAELQALAPGKRAVAGLVLGERMRSAKKHQVIESLHSLVES